MVEVLYEVWIEFGFNSATSVVNIPLPKLRRGREGSKGLGLNIFYYEVGYNHRNWGAHGCSMDLLVEGVVEGEVGDIEAKREQGDNVVGHQ